MKKAIILIFIALSIRYIIKVDEKTYIGDIELPLPHGQSLQFTYQPRNNHYRLQLFLEPLRDKQRHLSPGVWDKCQQEAEETHEPQPIVIPHNKQLENCINNSFYDKDNNLTTSGKIWLDNARQSNELRCIDRHRYGHAEFIIADYEPLIQFNVAQHGMGSMANSIRQSQRILTKDKTVTISISSTKNDTSLITADNPTGYYALYLKEIKPVKTPQIKPHIKLKTYPGCEQTDSIINFRTSDQ